MSSPRRTHVVNSFGIPMCKRPMWAWWAVSQADRKSVTCGKCLRALRFLAKKSGRAA